MKITPKLLQLFELANELNYSVYVNRQVWGMLVEFKRKQIDEVFTKL